MTLPEAPRRAPTRSARPGDGGFVVGSGPVTLVLAHRGASHHYPPNTLDAFRAAVVLGADGVELDVQLTREGIPVVHHDARLVDGHTIRHLSYRDLPVWVPTLDAVLAACEGLELVNIELKTEADDDVDERAAPADVVVALVDRLGMADRVLVSSFDAVAIDRVRALGSAAPTALLVSHPGPDAIDRAVAGGHSALNPWFGHVDADLVARATAAGLDVHPWTVDRPDDLRRLADLGVRSVITNRPDVARRVLDER